MTGLDYILFVKEIDVKDMSEKLGVNITLISLWRNGRRKISNKYINELETYLGVSSRFFLKENITGSDRVLIEIALGADLSVIDTPSIRDHMEGYATLARTYVALEELYTKTTEEHRVFRETVKGLIHGLD